MNVAPNRAVAIMTPLLFAPLAGAISVAAAKYLPGVSIDSGSMEAIFIAGATIAFGKAGIWLKGWQEHEKRQEALEPDAPDAGLAAVAVDAEPDLEPDGDAGDLGLEPAGDAGDLGLEPDGDAGDLDLEPDAEAGDLDLGPGEVGLDFGIDDEEPVAAGAED
jgi:hypothetical protein